MKFEVWSALHFVMILMPILSLILLYFLLRNKTYKTRYIVGVVIGVINIAILLTRNIDIFVRGGFNPEIIPLQVCHIGNITTFFALVFKNKTSAAIAWCLNLIPAFFALIFVDALANYQTILAIRPQAYIWGHIFIAIGAIYAVALKIVKIDFKAFLRAVGIVCVLCFVAIILNPYFNNVVNKSINYFYIYNSNEVPFDIFYNITKPIKIGSWFVINPMYVVCVTLLGVLFMALMYYLQKLMFKEPLPSRIICKRKKK